MAKAEVAELQVPGVLRSFNPVTGELVSEVKTATPSEVREAVERARLAQPGWGALGAEERAKALRLLAYEIRARMDDFVETVSAETGKPQVEALSHDVLPTLLTIRYLGRIAPKALRSQRVGRLIAPVLGLSSSIAICTRKSSRILAKSITIICRFSRRKDSWATAASCFAWQWSVRARSQYPAPP